MNWWPFIVLFAFVAGIDIGVECGRKLAQRIRELEGR